MHTCSISQQTSSLTGISIRPLSLRHNKHMRIDVHRQPSRAPNIDDRNAIDTDIPWSATHMCTYVSMSDDTQASEICRRHHTQSVPFPLNTIHRYKTRHVIQNIAIAKQLQRFGHSVRVQDFPRTSGTTAPASKKSKNSNVPNLPSGIEHTCSYAGACTILYNHPLPSRPPSLPLLPPSLCFTHTHTHTHTHTRARARARAQHMLLCRF
jgi:hypothetical protein